MQPFLEDLKKQIEGAQIKQVIPVFLFIALMVFALSFSSQETPNGAAIKTLPIEKELIPTEPVCIPTTEICDGKDNDCDKEVDEGVCNEIELTGDIEIIVVDDFENNKADYIYYLNDGGKRYELEFKEESLRATKQNVNIRGVLSERKILVDEIISVLGKTAEELEWPKTLGEQKYVVIYLTEEGDQIDTVEFTDFSFTSANEWINEASYGKASVSYEYGGNYTFNDNLCWFNDIFLDAVEKADPFVDYNNYDGIVVYHPNKGLSCTPYGGLANLGKSSLNTLDGKVEVYEIWMKKGLPDAYVPYNTLIHEMGHNFGLVHASGFFCGEFPNRKPLGDQCIHDEYLDHFDIMGNGRPLEKFNLRNKLTVLGWINEENVPEIEEGIYFISPFDEDSTSTSNTHGLRIPINWEITQGPPLLDTHAPLTHYYLEYRNHFSEEYFEVFENYNNEITYGLNTSEITGGVLLRLGRDSMEDLDMYSRFTNTWIITTHPNAEVCFDGQENCRNHFFQSSVFSYLLKGETYADEFNDITITVLDANEDGALVKISPYYGCGNAFLNEGELCDYAAPLGINNPFGEQCTQGCWVDGTAGGWAGCRGSGAHACVNWIPAHLIEQYFQENPLCIMNTTCGTTLMPAPCNEFVCPNPLEMISCYDNDTGLNYGVKGTVKATGNGTLTTKTDVCSGDTVREYYCDADKTIQYTDHPCTPDSCSNGACYGGSTPCVPTPENPCNIT